MASYRKDFRTDSSPLDTVHEERIREAEAIYQACVADFGCESGEAFTAEWHLREVQRQALSG